MVSFSLTLQFFFHFFQTKGMLHCYCFCHFIFGVLINRGPTGVRFVARMMPCTKKMALEDTNMQRLGRRPKKKRLLTNQQWNEFQFDELRGQKLGGFRKRHSSSFLLCMGAGEKVQYGCFGVLVAYSLWHMSMRNCKGPPMSKLRRERWKPIASPLASSPTPKVAYFMVRKMVRPLGATGKPKVKN